jgi:hypothetical protein
MRRNNGGGESGSALASRRPSNVGENEHGGASISGEKRRENQSGNGPVIGVMKMAKMSAKRKCLIENEKLWLANNEISALRMLIMA